MYGFHDGRRWQEYRTLDTARLKACQSLSFSDDIGIVRYEGSQKEYTRGNIIVGTVFEGLFGATWRPYKSNTAYPISPKGGLYRHLAYEVI